MPKTKTESTPTTDSLSSSMPEEVRKNLAASSESPRRRICQRPAELEEDWIGLSRLRSIAELSSLPRWTPPKP